MKRTVREMVKDWCKQIHATRILNRRSYRDKKTGLVIWRNTEFADKLINAAK